MKPVLQYVGSKVRLAETVIGLLPPHGSYVEPYLGSAAVLLAKDPVVIERVNDMDDDLINFYRMLRDRSTRYDLIDALVYTPYARKELEIAQGRHDPEGFVPDPVEKARRFMVRSNQVYVGSSSIGGNWVATTRPSSGHSNATKWNNYRTRLAQVAERLQNVQIDCADAIEVMASVWNLQDPQVAMYLDPPYVQHTRNGSKYSQDGMTEDHHERLLTLATMAVGPVVISSYPNPLYDARLGDGAAGWKKIELSRSGSSSAGRGSVARRTEVLWANEHCVVPEEPREEIKNLPLQSIIG